MLPLPIVLLTIATGFCGESSGAYEFERDVGNGYRLVTMGFATSGFESLTHYTYLFHASYEIGRANAPCVSPSGRYVAFEDPPTGKIRLFDARTMKVTAMSDASDGIPSQCSWDESKATLGISFSGKAIARSFRINQ